MDAQKDLVVNTVMFSAESIEISFMEKRDQSPHGGLIKTLVLEKARFADTIAEISEMLEDLVDDGLLSIRQPPETIDPRRRVRKGEREGEQSDEG